MAETIESQQTSHMGCSISVTSHGRNNQPYDLSTYPPKECNEEHWCTEMEQIHSSTSPGRGEVVDLRVTRKSSFFGRRPVNLRATRKFTGQ